MLQISIHAPLRERRGCNGKHYMARLYFNPRSLTGATQQSFDLALLGVISIHAPLRERHSWLQSFSLSDAHFNPRSLTGATATVVGTTNVRTYFNPRSLTGATLPSRKQTKKFKFQSTLPYGSDHKVLMIVVDNIDFNPRSLTGATYFCKRTFAPCYISIHAPLRERLHFACVSVVDALFQSTLPYGSDSIKTKYFSIHLNQAFIANRLNSNPQRFYFDVRKL